MLVPRKVQVYVLIINGYCPLYCLFLFFFYMLFTLFTIGLLLVSLFNGGYVLVEWILKQDNCFHYQTS